MKNKSVIKPIFVTLVMSLSIGISISIKENLIKVKASSYTVNTVPTNIDLNDTSASNIRSYYSSLNSLSTSERRGTNLLKNLKPILKNGQTYFSYSSSATTAVWQAYEIVDRDWEKSPASAISGYNASTNTITGYTYGTSNTSVGTNPYIHALYVNRNVDNEQQAWGNHQQVQWGINQEHIWAKSCGFDDNSPSVGARGDLMHLWAGNGKVNGTYHSNYYYGYVDTTKSYNDAASYASSLSGNLKGYSKSLGGTVTVFEPQDSDKGDIARACFYLAARYNYLLGSDSDGIDAGNPNLEIVNELSSWSNSGYQSTTTSTGKMGVLQDLLEWNRLDPPDQWEIHRNNLLYNNFTNNRNPFIDFPEWAEFIWGKSEDGNYSSSSTGYATPSNDSINGFDGSSVETKTLSSISISGQKTSFSQGEAFSFGGTVTATYSDSSTANVTSSATFSGYNMSTTGKQTVTVSYSEGGINKTVTYQITVNAASISSITASVNDDKTYYVGETISKSDITVTTNTGTDVTSSVTFNDYQFTYEDAASGGALTNKSFNISYGNLSTTLTAKVQRKAHEEATTVSDTLDRSFTGVSGTSYSSWSDKSAPNSSAVYAGQSAGGNSSIQLRSNNNNSGIVTTTSGGTLSSVSVTWNSNTTNGRTLNIYGKNSAYSSPTDLYSSSTQGTLLGTIVNGTSTSLTIEGSYTYIGIRSNSGAMYLTDVTFVYGAEDNATNVANYIMYEDTNGQCYAKFTVAKGYFEGLSKDNRATFMTSSDYVISTARTRLEAWASYLNKSITYADDDYTINPSKGIALINNINTNSNLVVISSIILTVVGGYFFLRKKDNNN